jgi:hypothetical protein
MRKILKEETSSEFYNLIEGVINGEYSDELTPKRFEPFFDIDNLEIYYNPTTPKNSPMRINYDDIDDFLKIFDDYLDYSDTSLVKSLFGGYYHYRGDVNFFEGEHAWEDWRGGSIFYYFNEQNKNLLKEILYYFPRFTFDLSNDEMTGSIALHLSNLFTNDINDIITEYQVMVDESMTDGIKDIIKDELCNPFGVVTIFMRSCMSSYLTNVSTIYDLLLEYGKDTENLTDLLFKIVDKKNNDFGGYYDYIWEQSHNIDDDTIDNFNRYVTKSLNNILESIEGEYEDSEDYEQLKKVLNYIHKLTSFKDSEFYEIPTMKDYYFRIVKINVSGVLLDLYKKEGNNFKVENRIKLSLYEFVPFIENYKLFESRKLRKKRIN